MRKFWMESGQELKNLFVLLPEKTVYFMWNLIYKIHMCITSQTFCHVPSKEPADKEGADDVGADRNGAYVDTPGEAQKFQKFLIEDIITTSQHSTEHKLINVAQRGDPLEKLAKPIGIFSTDEHPCS